MFALLWEKKCTLAHCKYFFILPLRNFSFTGKIFVFPKKCCVRSQTFTLCLLANNVRVPLRNAAFAGENFAIPENFAFALNSKLLCSPKNNAHLQNFMFPWETWHSLRCSHKMFLHSPFIRLLATFLHPQRNVAFARKTFIFPEKHYVC